MSEVELGGATVFPSLGARIPPTYVSQLATYTDTQSTVLVVMCWL